MQNRMTIKNMDANNLYGWAMSQPLPKGEFEKLSFPGEYEHDQIVEDSLQNRDNNEKGFFIECDLEYPAEIKQKTENFPLCPYQTEANPSFFQ